MSSRATAVKAIYKPIKNSELKSVAEIYNGMLGKPGVLAQFTAKDAAVDGTWVTNFGLSITAVGNIVPSRTISLTNKDITKSIKDGSKLSVKYGKVLTYYLKKAFPNQAGLIESFRVVEANKKMRNGETEGMLFELNTLIQQVNVTANKNALIAAGWPVSNLADYVALMGSVDTLNTQQELAKKLIPENTDDAVTVRNTCYGFIKTLLALKDIVYYEQLQKRHDWALTTNLNQIRAEHGGGGGGATGAIGGQVNSVGNQPATVVVVGTSLTATTNPLGGYSINNVPVGSQNVSAWLSSNPGNVKTQSVMVIAGGVVNVSFSFP